MNITQEGEEQSKIEKSKILYDKIRENLKKVTYSNRPFDMKDFFPKENKNNKINKNEH